MLKCAAAMTRSDIYRTLRSKTSIRLLKILPSSHMAHISPRPNTPNFELVETELEHSPPFIALSYTWKDPIALAQYPAQLQTGENIEVMLCNGVEVIVGSNLHQALRRIQNSDQVGEDIFPGSHMQARFYWVDALCINQGDLDEKNEQVNLMNMIYIKAQGVLVWLGQDMNPLEVHGIEAITEIAARSTPEKAKTATRYNMRKASSYDALGLRRLDISHWIGLYLLLSRSWFRRAWVIQELAFAACPMVVCGAYVFPWNYLSSLVDFLRTSLWHTQLHFLIVEHVSFRDYGSGSMWEADIPVPGHQKLLQEMPTTISIFTRSAKAVVCVGALYNTLYGLQGTRNGVIGNSREDYSNRTLRPLFFHELLITHTSSEASDARDKVYALVAVSYESISNREHSNLLQVDYRKPIEEVYTDVSRVLMFHHRDLKLLSLSTDCKERYSSSRVDYKKLPSWTPNFDTVVVDDLGSCFSLPWHASNGLRWQGPYDAIDGRFLRINGFRAGAIHAVVKGTDRDGYLFNTANLLRERPVATNIREICQNKKVLQYRDKLQIPGKVKNDSHDFQRASLLPSALQTSFEIWWRTLISDNYDGFIPAPRRYGQEFAEVLLKELNGRNHLAVAAGLRNQANWRKQLIVRIRETMAFIELVSEEVRKSGDMVPSNYVKERAGPFSVLLSNPKNLFKTDNGYLGSSKGFVEAGDHVWILRGCNVPMILRAQRGEVYRLVGEAYVHGMMFGEAFCLPHPVFESILLS